MLASIVLASIVFLECGEKLALDSYTSAAAKHGIDERGGEARRLRANARARLMSNLSAVSVYGGGGFHQAGSAHVRSPLVQNYDDKDIHKHYDIRIRRCNNDN